MSLLRPTLLMAELADEVARGLEQYRQLTPGAKIAVALSGGKDSWTVLTLLNQLRREGRLSHALLAIHIDLGFDGRDERHRLLEEGCARENLELVLIQTDVGPQAVAAPDKRPCFLCVRERRRQLFTAAVQHGAGLLATGHHRDDVLASFFLNLLENREISTLMPRQAVFDGALHLIRPLYTLPEARVQKLVRQQAMPIVDSGCPVAGATRRARAEDLLSRIDQLFPEGREALFTALHRVKPDFLP